MDSLGPEAGAVLGLAVGLVIAVMLLVKRAPEIRDEVAHEGPRNTQWLVPAVLIGIVVAIMLASGH